jgi:hypothetical protein
LGGDKQSESRGLLQAQQERQQRKKKMMVLWWWMASCRHYGQKM